jgi:hypothetical protein
LPPLAVKLRELHTGGSERLSENLPITPGLRRAADARIATIGNRGGIVEIIQIVTAGKLAYSLTEGPLGIR